MGMHPSQLPKKKKGPKKRFIVAYAELRDGGELPSVRLFIVRAVDKRAAECIVDCRADRRFRYNFTLRRL